MALLQTSEEDLTGKRIGLFSYGSGCMAVFFSGTVLEGYVNALEKESHRKSLDDREALTYKQYENFYTHRLPTDGRDYQTDRHKTGAFRLAGIRNHKRQYEVQKQKAGQARKQTDGDLTVAIAG